MSDEVTTDMRKKQQRGPIGFSAGTTPTPRVEEPQPVKSWRPRWRKMTWALIIWTVLMGIWIVAGASTASGTPKDCAGLSAQTCNDAADAGTAIGVGLLVFLWGFGFVILSLIWFMTRPRNR